jgi:hypothetical protein
MAALLVAIRRSLAELDLALKGTLTMSEGMEQLMLALARDAVPLCWSALAYPSLRPLGSWVTNLIARAGQLADWTSDFTVPTSVWLSGASNVSDHVLESLLLLSPPGRAEEPKKWYSSFTVAGDCKLCCGAEVT